MTGLDSLSYSVPFSGKLALDKHASKACFASTPATSAAAAFTTTTQLKVLRGIEI